MKNNCAISRNMKSSLNDVALESHGLTRVGLEAIKKWARIMQHSVCNNVKVLGQDLIVLLKRSVYCANLTQVDTHRPDAMNFSSKLRHAWLGLCD